MGGESLLCRTCGRVQPSPAEDGEGGQVRQPCTFVQPGSSLWTMLPPLLREGGCYRSLQAISMKSGNPRVRRRWDLSEVPQPGGKYR